MKKRWKIAGLVVALMVIVLGGVLFVGAAAGWFADSRVELSAEYYCEDGCEESLTTVTSAAEYEELSRSGKSFVLFIDQGGCVTAEKLRGFLENYLEEKGVWGYSMLFSDVKESSLYGTVKYYPSVVVFDGGEPVAVLRADAEEDAAAYNEEGAFREWISRYL